MATDRSINSELRTDLNALRTRVRVLVKNNDFAQKFKQLCKINIVGPTGFTFQSNAADQTLKGIVADNLARQTIEQGFADWCKVCDITGRQTFKEICETLVGGLPSDGEFLIRMIRGKSAGNAFDFALQIIDVARIDTQYNVAAGSNSNAVYMGVEVNAFQRPVALHLFDGSPNSDIHSNRNRTRVEMSDLIHGYKVEFPEQLRGIPWMASGMLSLHHLGAFQLSAIMAAEHGAKHLGFFVNQDGEAPESIDSVQDLQYDTLPFGTTVEVPDMRYPNDMFGPFCAAALRRTASGLGVSYHSLTSDLENVNFSSIRSGTLEERDRWMCDQTWFDNVFLSIVVREWLKQALLSKSLLMPNGSALPAAKFAKFSNITMRGRRWEWVDPLKDMQAKVLAVTAGLASPQDVLAEMGGGDLGDILAKISEAQTLAASLGIKLPAYDAKPGANSGNGNNAGNNGNNAGDGSTANA